jgi:hypothetical protein
MLKSLLNIPAAVVPHQINFHQPRLRLVPLGEGPDRDLVLKQRAGLGARAAAQGKSFALTGKQPINARRTDLQQLLSSGRAECDLTIPLQDRDHLRQDRRQPLATNEIQDNPNRLELLDYPCVIHPAPAPLGPTTQIADEADSPANFDGLSVAAQ